MELDMERIKQLHAEGKKPGQIAQELGVSRFVIRDRLEKLKDEGLDG